MYWFKFGVVNRLFFSFFRRKCSFPTLRPELDWYTADCWNIGRDGLAGGGTLEDDFVLEPFLVRICVLAGSEDLDLGCREDL